MNFVASLSYSDRGFIDCNGVSLRILVERNRHGNFVVSSLDCQSLEKSLYLNEAIKFCNFHKLTFSKSGQILNFIGCKNLKIKCNNIEKI